MKDKTNRCRRSLLWINWTLALLLALGAVTFASASLYAQDATEQDAAAEEVVSGYPYVVEDGDNWDVVAAKTGVSVTALQAANPDAVRDTGWLLTGEELTIPLPDEVPSKTHQVSPGESWSTIADEYGITMAALQAANQKAVRPGMILYNGEKLLIPPPAPVEEEEAEEAAEPEAEVEDDAASEPAEEADAEDAAEEPAESDATVEDAAEQAAEPTPVAEEEASAEEAGAAEEITSTAPITPTVVITESASVTETPAITPTAGMTETVIEAEVPDAEPAVEEEAAEDPQDTTEAAAPETEDAVEDAVDEDSAADEAAEDEAGEQEVALPACPELLVDYPDAIVAALNASDGSADALTAFLTDCGAQVEDGVVASDLTGDGVEELVVVYQNPSQESTFVESDLIIVAAGDDGFEVVYRARAAGEVRLVAAEDVNADGQVDVVWIDTTCGASTCFDTVNVRSWDGSVWADWTDGTITMAYADIELADVLEDGGGQEIELTGGIYGSVGAGPQRSRTETWASLDGAPYALADKVYSESECLYHTVLDANRLLAEAGMPEDLDAARALYEKAVTDESLIKCWVRPAELEELRSFSLFRMAVIDAYEGDLESAANRITELAATYPDGALVDAAQTWLDTVGADGALDAACEAVTAFAQENPEVWEILADYGYTNPSFEASDLCPPPDLTGEGAGEESTEDGATGASPRSDPGAEAGEADAAPGSDAAQDAAEADNDAIAAIAENLPDCPAALAEYGDALPLVVEESGGDLEIVQRWLYACGALADDRGAVLTAELNGDGVEDFIVFPTVISDVGLGPEGAQGGVLLVHSGETGEFELAASPQVFGKPAPLAVEDLNGDGDVDVAWTVEGCSTFCMLETQILTWHGEEYVSLIEPGAALASGEATIEDVEADDIGSGKRLVLSGGVSGTPEGGLTVAHEEIWQSVDGTPFQRMSWAYDRDAAGANCLGLRLVEADVALQAANALGYGPAFEKYAQALEPGLEACSIFGLQPEEELALLQGLANFRFIQVQALDEDLEGAQASLDFFAEELAGSPYVQAAQTWLDGFVASGDAAAACEGVASLLEEYPELWQITDHFGYNHPALAAEQICFVP